MLLEWSDIFFRVEMYGPAGQETKKSFISKSSKVSGDRKQISTEMTKKQFLRKDVNHGNGFQSSHPRHATSSRMSMNGCQIIVP
jgi:hypothetical protein